MNQNTTQAISQENTNKTKKRNSTGLRCIFIGAFLGFASCLLSILNPVPDLYYHVLYGLTSIAIAVVFVGLYCIFE